MIRLPYSNLVYTPSIRAGLAVLILGCILPLAGMAAFLVFNAYDQGRAQLAQAAIGRARTLVSIMDRDVETTQAALFALGTSPYLAQGDLRAFHAQARAAQAKLLADSILVLEPSGQIVLSTSRPLGEPLPKVANPLLLKRMLKDGKPGISDLFYGPVVGRLIYTIAVPIKRDGEFVYSLNASVPPDQPLRVLSEQKFPDSWRAAITDSTGSIVARSHATAAFFGKKVAPELLQSLSLANEGSLEATSLEGIPVLTAYSRSPVTKWVAAVGIPLAEVTGGLHRALAWLVLATLAALVAGLLWARAVGRRIARSVTALTAPAMALGSGVSMTIPVLHFAEANELRQAFLDAGDNLRQSQYQAHHDVLTGLANRALFHSFVERQLSLCRRNASSLAILYIDLDGFKAVNDTHGHAVGDLLLRAVALRLKGCLRDSDILSRLGGDEFAVAAVQLDMVPARVLAEELIAVVSAPCRLGEVEVQVSASIGVAGYPASATDIDSLLLRADRAMYRAKNAGKRCVCLAEDVRVPQVGEMG